jgi:hypothetical protein
MDLDRIAILLEYPDTIGGLVNARKAGATHYSLSKKRSFQDKGFIRASCVQETTCVSEDVKIK